MDLAESMDAPDHIGSRSPAAHAEYWQARLKRLIDLLGAGLALLFLLPLMLAIAILIRFDSPGPVLFRQSRVGRDDQLFDMVKFRTMAGNSAQLLEDHFNRNPARRLDWEHFQKLYDDPRLTETGRFLRRFSLDELPQFWNVLKGEMSLVGPRPPLPEQRRYYGEQLDLITSVRPGMTGLWQVAGRNRLSFAERVALDAFYLRSWNLALDLRILLRTVAAVLRGDGAF